MTRSLPRLGAAALAAALLAGCSDPSFGTLTGRVTLDGQPVEDGVIQFVPVNKDAPTANCFIKGGEYTARVPVTTHKVIISSPQKVGGGKPSASATLDESRVQETIPARYNTKSELKIEVKPGTAETNFELKK
jgi:hypothetical protein